MNFKLISLFLLTIKMKCLTLSEKVMNLVHKTMENNYWSPQGSMETNTSKLQHCVAVGRGFTWKFIDFSYDYDTPITQRYTGLCFFLFLVD